MKTTKDYLAEIRQKFPKAKTTYAMGKLLGVSFTTAARYEKEDGRTFDETVARRVAELLGKNPAVVILDMQIERAQTEESKALWEQIAAGFPWLLRLAETGLGFTPTRM